jgi:DNA-directed RNA polymerase subunit RPC12/RpoP
MPQILGIEEPPELRCPHCGNERTDLLERIAKGLYLCSVCSKLFTKKE